jgi:hypothetical protein
MKLSLIALVPVAAFTLFATGCSTPALSPQGAAVAVSRNPAPPTCTSVGYIEGTTTTVTITGTAYRCSGSS